MPRPHREARYPPPDRDQVADLCGTPSVTYVSYRWIVRQLRAGRHVACRHIAAGAEEIFLHLRTQVLAGARIGQMETVLVDQHRLVALPLLPGLLGNVLEDPFAEVAGYRGKIESLQFAPQLDAVHHPCHGISSWWASAGAQSALIRICDRRCQLYSPWRSAGRSSTVA